MSLRVQRQRLAILGQMDGQLRHPQNRVVDPNEPMADPAAVSYRILSPSSTTLSATIRFPFFSTIVSAREPAATTDPNASATAAMRNNAHPPGRKSETNLRIRTSKRSCIPQF